MVVKMYSSAAFQNNEALDSSSGSSSKIDAAKADASTLINLSGGRLRDLLKYFFLPATLNASKMKKDALLAAVNECVENYKRLREEEAEEEGLNQIAVVEA